MRLFATKLLLMSKLKVAIRCELQRENVARFEVLNLQFNFSFNLCCIFLC